MIMNLMVMLSYTLNCFCYCSSVLIAAISVTVPLSSLLPSLSITVPLSSLLPSLSITVKIFTGEH